jgi:hypothetical protein
MRSWRFAVAVALGLTLAVPVAGDPASGVDPGAGAVAENASPAAEASAGSGEAAPAEPVASSGHRIELGPVGHDAQGRPGRIHVVAPGDTLWDISDAYLGTPWVWPSVWKENQAIDDPHLIHPGDRIWIGPGEMRRVSAEEADALLGGAASDEFPAALDMDGVPGAASPAPRYRYSEIQTIGFVTEQEFQGAASIVDTPVDRRYLADHDEVVIGLGEGQATVGEQFQIFRRGDRVFHPATGQLTGWSTEELGWLEVTEVHPESSKAVIRLSRGEIETGDRLLPRRLRGIDIEVRQPPHVEGQVLFTPDRRLQMGSTDLVYLDRGAVDGLEVGSPLEVYRPMGEAVDAARDETVAVPDHVVAKLLVVEAREATAAAVVTHTTMELNRGDRFRGTGSGLGR